MDTTSLKNTVMTRLEKVTTIMGVIGHFATYIQAFKIFYLQSSYAISFIATIISFTSMVFWIFYGIEKNVRPLIICNVFGLIGISLILWGIILYGKNFL